MKRPLLVGILLSVVVVAIASPKSLTSDYQPSLNRIISSEIKAEITPKILPVTAQIQIGTEIIELEVASTPQQQQQGLMYRQALPKNRGMLFSFNPPRIARFWMKNTLISLDMIFLRDGKIKAILTDVPPCRLDPCPTYGPTTEVDQVIELSAGRAQELGLEVGQSLEIMPLLTSQSTH